MVGSELLGDLTHFPFLAEVWGTAADWAIAIFTIGSVIYLIKTFKAQSKAISLQQQTLQSQLEVQSLNLKQTRIENERFRAENLPKFDIKLSSTHVEHTPIGYHIWFRLDITLTSCFSRNVFINIDSNKPGLTFRNEITPISVFEVNTKLTVIPTINVDSHDYEGDGVEITVVIDYSDPVDNTYTQEFKIIISEKGNEVKTSGHPILRTT